MGTLTLPTYPNIHVGPGHWSRSKAIKIANYFDVVLTAMQRFFQVPNLSDKTFDIILTDAIEGGFYQYGTNAIFLNFDPRSENAEVVWPNLASIYIHEMCHELIGSHEQRVTTWFEEVICETASLFFMKILAVDQTHNSFLSGELLGRASLYEQYYSNISNNILTLRASDIARNPELLRFLEIESTKNMEARKIYQTLAVEILPRFLEAPDLWTAVPLIGNWSAADHISESLSTWHKTAPDSSKRAIFMLNEAFGYDSST